MSKERDVRMKTASRQRRCQDRRCQRKQHVLTERGLKIKVWNNRKQEKWCQAKTVSREWDVERRECQEKKVSKKEMPKAKDAKRKRRQRKAAETTSVSRDSNDIRKACQERRVCQVSGFRAVDKKGCQDSEMSGASQIKRKWQHQTKMSRARNVKDKDFQEITQSTAVPARRSAVPIGSPLSFRFFPLSKLPSPGLPGLYLYILYIYIWLYMYITSRHCRQPRAASHDFSCSMSCKIAKVSLHCAAQEVMAALNVTLRRHPQATVRMSQNHVKS